MRVDLAASFQTQDHEYRCLRETRRLLPHSGQAAAYSPRQGSGSRAIQPNSVLKQVRCARRTERISARHWRKLAAPCSGPRSLHNLSCNQVRLRRNLGEAPIKAKRPCAFRDLGVRSAPWASLSRNGPARSRMSAQSASHPYRPSIASISEQCFTSPLLMQLFVTEPSLLASDLGLTMSLRLTCIPVVLSDALPHRFNWNFPCARPPGRKHLPGIYPTTVLAMLPGWYAALMCYRQASRRPARPYADVGSAPNCSAQRATLASPQAVPRTGASAYAASGRHARSQLHPSRLAGS